MKFECKYCGHDELYIYEKPFESGTGRHIGLGCAGCGRHQKWISKPLFIQLRDEGHELKRHLP